MLPFHRVAADDFQAVNDLIIRQLYSEVPLVENIGHYLIEAGGKRLRPLLVLLVAKALGYQDKQHLDLAVIIEFIHTATLLHDDVVDTSTLRRGRPTANAEWGNAPSVLVGDFLYSRAFQMMVAIADMEVMTLLSEATNTIAEGEVQQLVNARDASLGEADYRRVIEKKTAVLFAAACEGAAVLAGANETQRQAMRHYGLQVGTAFQLVDDALDYQGDAADLGKNLGDDLAEGKPTLPLIHAMRNAPADDRKLIQKAIENADASQLQQIAAIVNTSGGIEYTLAEASRAVTAAEQHLEVLEAGPYRQALIDIARFALERQH